MLTNTVPNIPQEAIALYSLACKNYSFDTSLAVLHISSDYTLLMVGAQIGMPDYCWQFAIGKQRTAVDFFKHNPPTAGEMENAIMTVEDEIMQVRKFMPAGAILLSSDAGIKEIHAQFFASQRSSDGQALFRSDMEAVFGRLSAIVSGRPASSDTLPQTSSFAATLLILREVMFHLGFEKIDLC